MRVSSVMFSSLSSGTFRSARSNTTLPFRSASERSPTLFLAMAVTRRKPALPEALPTKRTEAAEPATEPDRKAVRAATGAARVATGRAAAGRDARVGAAARTAIAGLKATVDCMAG